MTSVIGVIAMAVVAWLMWARKGPRATVVLAMVAGVTLAGGMLYDLATRGSNILQSFVNTISNSLIGASASAVIGVLLCLELWRVLTRKGGGHPNRFVHPALGFMAPVLLAAAGGIFADLAGLLDSGVDSVRSMIPAVFGGQG